MRNYSNVSEIFFIHSTSCGVHSISMEIRKEGQTAYSSQRAELLGHKMRQAKTAKLRIEINVF